MASPVAAAVAVATPLGQKLSGIFGSVSLAAWVFLLLPQLWTNYKAKSADGLSLTFLTVWALGDASNLSGALLTSLAPSAIALAIYFCFLDTVLICQCLYYNTLNARAAATAVASSDYGTVTAVDDADDAGTSPREDSPLLVSRRASSPASTDSTRRASPARSGRKNVDDENVVAAALLDDSSSWVYNTFCLLGVVALGVAGWTVSYMAGAWHERRAHAPAAPDNRPSPAAMGGLVLGYVSAVFYLCARVPQIIKNYREKSCEGLSLLFFMLSLVGNFTYGLSLVAFSQDAQYLIRALPWLLGSMGTMVEDAAIFVQFRMYRNRQRGLALAEM